MKSKALVVIPRPYERYGALFPSSGLCWFAEEIESVTSNELGPQHFSVDDIILDEKEEEKEEVVVKEEKEEPEIEVEGETKISSDVSEVAELRKQVQSLQGDLLKISLEKRELVKPDVQKKERLTRPQLIAIMKEHKDDPEVLLNITEYLAEQKAEEIKDATMKDVNQRQWYSNLSGMENKIFSEDEDGYLAANPKVKGQLNEYATNLGLGDHPLGKLAAYAIFRLSETVKGKGVSKQVVKPDGEKADANKGKMDKTRLTTVRNKEQGLSAEQLAMAKRFGVKPETYSRFVGGNKK